MCFCETSGLFCFPMSPYGGFKGLKTNLARLPNLHYKVFIKVAAMSGLNPSMLSIIHDLNGMLNLSLIILVNHRIFLGKVDCGANLVWWFSILLSGAPPSRRLYGLKGVLPMSLAKRTSIQSCQTFFSLPPFLSILAFDCSDLAIKDSRWAKITWGIGGYQRFMLVFLLFDHNLRFTTTAY